MTDEPTPSEITATGPKPVSFSAVVTASLITCLITGAGIVAAHQAARRQTQELQYSVNDGLEKLAQRVTALETQTRELAARPIADNAPVEELRSNVAEAKNTLSQLSDRLAEVEKKPATIITSPPAPATAAAVAAPAPTPLKSAILSGAPYQAELQEWRKQHPKPLTKMPTLESYAAKGLPTEQALRKELAALIEKQSAPTTDVDEHSLAGRVNARLSQFISIKKKNTAAPELEALRGTLETAPLTTLEATLRNLQTAKRAPFESWLQAVSIRTRALNELPETEDAQ